MKKLKCMLIGALMSVGVMVSAADPVYSVNVVGFTRITIPAAKMAIIGVPFTSMSGNQTLEDVLGTNQIKIGTWTAHSGADKVWVWDYSAVPPGYKSFALKTNSFGAAKYFPADINWTNPAAATNPTIRAGDSFWVRLTGFSPATTLTLMGEVIASTSETNLIKGSGSLKLVSLPYSQAVKLKDTRLAESGMRGGTAASSSAADKLWMWNMTNSAYEQYAIKKAGAATNWYRCDGYYWTNGLGLADDVVVDLGLGFWLRTTGFSPDFNWVATNQYLGNLQ